MILHPRRLGDPYVAGWVLKQIKYAREVGDLSRADELEALFDELTLRRIIETGSQILVADIFINLRTNLFISLQKYMLDNWPSWKGYTAHRSAVKLAELAPQDFRRILTRFVERPNILRDKSMLRGAFEAAALMGKDATEIARALVAKVEERGDRMEWWSFLADMVHTATDNDADTAIALLVRGFEEAEEEYERRSLEASLSAAYEVITCDLPYLDHVWDISEKQSKQGFRQLAELFRSGAPLESIDAAARAKGHKRLAAALELLPEEGQYSKAVGFARKLANAAPKSPDSQECAMLASFLLAATAAHYARESFAFEGYDMSSLTSIASYDIVDLPCYPAIVDSLQRFHIDDMAPAMIKALKKGRNHFGGVHLTRMMGDLKHPGFVDPLIQCISESSGDFISESAMGALAKIGAEARQTIISRWSGLDSSQKIYGYGVIERIGGDEKTVQFLAGCFAEARPEPNIFDCWCSAAEGVPDRRLLDILEGELHRELYVADDTYSTLCAILDIDRPQLKEARKRAERQDDLASNKSLDELTVEDVMDKPARMELRCESCSETNQFEISGIFMSPKHPKDGFCIGGDITCPSCGSYGPFEPGKMGMIAATAELLKFTMAARSGVEYRGPLQFFTSSLHDGRLVSPSTALKEYRRRVECNPASVPDSLGLGNIYVKIGSRKLAADCFIRCLALDPRCAEAAFSLALIRFDNGDLAGAYKLLDDAWQLRKQWRFHRLRDCSPEDLTAEFVDLHNKIGVKLGKPKLSIPGHRAPSIAVGKVGRNAPCPCGSGKKYKKCCGTGGSV